MAKASEEAVALGVKEGLKGSTEVGNLTCESLKCCIGSGGGRRGEES